MRTTLLLILISLSIQSNLFSQPEGVKNQLVTVAYLMAVEGFEITHNARYDYLDEYESENYDLTLRKGYSYKIIAVCDGDCGDIDLKLYDGNGNFIAKDTGDDDYPIVEVAPRWTGEFTLNLKMYDCNIEPCGIGIIVFGQ